MYRKNANGWLKHIDFIILDMICLQIAFVLAYFIKNGNTEQKKEEPVAVSVQETTAETLYSDQDFDDLNSSQDPSDFEDDIPF